MKLLLVYLLIFATAILSAQSMDKTVVASAGNTMTNSEVTIGYTIGEPIIGMVYNDGSIDQGFWAGSLLVEPISEVGALNGIKVYPNPVIDELNIYTDGNQIYGITLFGVDGKRAMLQKVDSTLLEHKINLSYLSKGMYVLHLLVEGTNDEKLFKIIKK